MYGHKSVSKENILELINEYDIFSKYVSNFKEVGQKFISELRRDVKPTCVIAKLGNSLLYRDFAEFKAIDCFEYIKKKYVVNYLEALEMINLDFNLNLSPVLSIKYTPTPSIKHQVDISKIPKLPVSIEVTKRNWAIQDKRYWKDKYNLSSAELEEANIFPISAIWLNGMYIKTDAVAYAYYFGEAEDGRKVYKIYQPYSKTLKWISNCQQSLLQGEDLLPWVGELLIITKSYKDVLVLKKLHFNAVAPHGETMSLDSDKIAQLYKRFPKIVLLYDNDEPGIKAVTKLTEQTLIPHFFLPDGTKDVSDFVELYSYEALDTYLSESINIIGNNTSMGE